MLLKFSHSRAPAVAPCLTLEVPRAIGAASAVIIFPYIECLLAET
jgi:hypothetical protein